MWAPTQITLSPRPPRVSSALLLCNVNTGRSRSEHGGAGGADPRLQSHRPGHSGHRYRWVPRVTCWHVTRVARWCGTRGRHQGQQQHQHRQLRRRRGRGWGRGGALPLPGPRQEDVRGLDAVQREQRPAVPRHDGRHPQQEDLGGGAALHFAPQPRHRGRGRAQPLHRDPGGELAGARHRVWPHRAGRWDDCK